MIVTEHEVFNKALNTFGIRHQIIKCVEELSELQKELCKQANNEGTKDKIINELADVEITLEQMKIGLNINYFDLKHVRNQKINRLNANIDLLAKQADDEPKDEAKCRECAFKAMTKEQLMEIGKDPCLSCGNNPSKRNDGKAKGDKS